MARFQLIPVTIDDGGLEAVEFRTELYSFGTELWKHDEYTYIHACMHACIHAYIHRYIDRYIGDWIWFMLPYHNNNLFRSISNYNHPISKPSHRLACRECHPGSHLPRTLGRSTTRMPRVQPSHLQLGYDGEDRGGFLMIFVPKCRIEGWNIGVALQWLSPKSCHNVDCFTNSAPMGIILTELWMVISSENNPISPMTLKSAMKHAPDGPTFLCFCPCKPWNFWVFFFFGTERRMGFFSHFNIY